MCSIKNALRTGKLSVLYCATRKKYANESKFVAQQLSPIERLLFADKTG
jgi:hypothetical protein